MGCDDVVGQLARGHRGVIDAVEIERAPGAGLCKRGRSVAAVINSQAIEDFRAAEPLSNDRPDRRFMSDVHGRPPFLQANSSCDSTGSSISGPRAVSFRSFRSTVRLTPRNAAACATETCRANVRRRTAFFKAVKP